MWLILALLWTTACQVAGSGVGTAPSPSSVPVAVAPATPPTSPASPAGLLATKPTTEANSQAQRWAQAATWAPGQLESHFEKHGREGPYRSIQEYDGSARETIIIGTPFTYRDRTSRAQRLGFYHPESNRFASLTSDGRRITTFFHPDRHDNYVRGLDQSTYR